MPNINPFIRPHTQMLDALGITYDLRKGGKHLKLRIRLGESKRFIVLPSTPSGHRSLQNSLSQLRRTLRALQAEAASQGQRLASC